jgi:pimeloyl-ACP methyl ester carboxylesterase
MHQRRQTGQEDEGRRAMSQVPRRLGICLVVLLLGTMGIAQAANGDRASASSGDASRTCQHGDQGRLVGFHRVASHPTPNDARAYFKSWIDFYRQFYHFPSDLVVDIEYGFDTYKVTYCTIDVAPPGKRRPPPTIATGNVSVPRKAGPLSTVTFLHGTPVAAVDGPSNPNIFESFAGPPSSAIFAGGGFLYVAPDYLGVGDSTVPRHRYFHAATEASSAADLLKASGQVLRSLRAQRNDELFTFGFSQGGHSALALQRLLERRRIQVAATATVGGVFDVERFFLSSVANETTVTLPLIVSYILLAYDDIYDIYAHPADVFRQPYAATVPALFDMRHSFGEVLAGLPPTSRDLLQPSFLAAVRDHPGHLLRVRLRQNAVDRWRPEAPIRVYHSPDDEEVFFADVLVSAERLRRRGAGVTVERLPGFDHLNSWIQAMPRAVRWFRTPSASMSAASRS